MATDRSPDAADALTPAAFHILLSLSDDERHGYGIMREVADRTRGEFSLGPGTLYRSIKRLVEAGLISEIEATGGSAAADDDRRRFYRITRLGRRVLRTEAQRLARLVAQANIKHVLEEAR